MLDDLHLVTGNVRYEKSATLGPPFRLKPAVVRFTVHNGYSEGNRYRHTLPYEYERTVASVITVDTLQPSFKV